MQYAGALLNLVVAMVPIGLLALQGCRAAEAVRGKVLFSFFRGWHPTGRRSPGQRMAAAVLDTAMASLLGDEATEGTAVAIAATTANPPSEITVEQYNPW